MRVLMLVQAIDERDWLRAFIVDWVRSLAAAVDYVDVVTLERGEASLPENVAVCSLGKEQGKDRARELLRFHAAMRTLAPAADVIFSHMTPRYTILAAPYAAAFGKRQVLWYTHRNPSRQLRLALRLCWRAATATPDSFPIASPKVRALGHGIDTAFFSPRDTTPAVSNRVVHVARLMPIKHQATLVRALADVPDAHAVLVGAVPAGQKHYASYADDLRQLAADLGVSDRVTFAGGLLAPAVRDAYRDAAVAVNLSPPGLFDKSALESMAVGVPTVVCSPAFDPVLGQHAAALRLRSPEDAGELASTLRTLLALPEPERARIGRDLREAVVAAHSLERLMPRLARLFATGEPD